MSFHIDNRTVCLFDPDCVLYVDFDWLEYVESIECEVMP